MDLGALPPRIARRIAPPNEDGCMIWMGSKSAKGYGTVAWKGENRRVHRVVWTILVGPIPDGMTIDHVAERGCKSKACANIEHMELVTSEVNTSRSAGNKGRGSHERAKTHCPQGHPYDDENTYWYRGQRQCKICRAFHNTNRKKR